MMMDPNDRRTYLGGGDALAIVTGDWRRLWRTKTGREEPEDLSWNIPVQIGLATEDLNARFYEHFTGVKPDCRGVFRQGDGVRLPKWFAGHLDWIGQTTFGAFPFGIPCYTDAKWCARADEARTLRYTAQCTHYAILIDVEYWQLSLLTGVGKWELIEQEVDPFFAADYLSAAKAFWSYVEADKEPPDDVPPLGVPKPAARVLRTVCLDDAQRETWPNWGGNMVEYLGKWATTLASHQAHEISKREIKDLLPEDVGIVTRGKIKVHRDKSSAVRINLVKNGGTEP